MKRVISILFMFTLVFFVFGSQNVSAETTVSDFASGEKIKTGLMDTKEFAGHLSLLPGTVHDNSLDTFVRFSLFRDISFVTFYNPQDITYMYVKQSVNQNIFRYDFFDSDGVITFSYTPSEVSSESVHYLNLEDVSQVKLIKINTSAVEDLYYELDFFYEEDVFPPSEINSFEYSFSDDLKLEMTFKLPPEADFSHLKIYKNNVLLRDNFQLDNFQVAGISPHETNQFRIVSVDKSGNESKGFIKTITSPDGPDFVPPQNILELKYIVTRNSIQFKYIMPFEPDFSHLQIYRNNKLIVENHKINSFNDSGLEYDTNYEYVFKSVDNSGNVSEGTFVSVISGSEVDLTPPDVPTGLTVKNGNSALYVVWNPNSETDVNGYNIFIDDVKYNGALISGNSFSIPNLENAKTYNIKISAVDTSANESGLTAGVNGVPDYKGMPIVKIKNNLSDVASSTENWFSQLWLILAFGVSIPLAFIVGSRVKSLFLG